MKRLSNKQFNRKRRRPILGPSTLLSNSVNLYQVRSRINISLAASIYTYTSTGLYTFANASDDRATTFAQMIAGVEFSTYSMVYKNYRIVGASIVLTPVIGIPTTAGSIGFLYFCVDVNATAGNPTNSSFILKDNNHVFSPVSIAPKIVKYNLKSVGKDTDVWLDVSTVPDGQFVIGNNPSPGITTNYLVFDAQLQLQIEFCNPL